MDDVRIAAPIIPPYRAPQGTATGEILLVQRNSCNSEGTVVLHVVVRRSRGKAEGVCLSALDCRARLWDCRTGQGYGETV